MLTAKQRAAECWKQMAQIVHANPPSRLPAMRQTVIATCIRNTGVDAVTWMCRHARCDDQEAAVMVTEYLHYLNGDDDEVQTLQQSPSSRMGRVD